MSYAKRCLGTVAFVGRDVNPTEFTSCWGRMIQFLYEYYVEPGTYIHVDESSGSGQIRARNELSVKMQGDWLLQVDTDHTFDPDMALRLLNLMQGGQLDVVTGLYHFKEPPFDPVVFRYIDGKYHPLAGWDRSVKLLSIDAAGAGCLLVRRSVFDRLRTHYNEHPFDPIGPYNTDDFNFFERCRRIGVQSWCAVQVEARHLTRRAIGLADFDSSFCGDAIQTSAQARA